MSIEGHSHLNRSHFTYDGDQKRLPTFRKISQRGLENNHSYLNRNQSTCAGERKRLPTFIKISQRGLENDHSHLNRNQSNYLGVQDRLPTFINICNEALFSTHTAATTSRSFENSQFTKMENSVSSKQSGSIIQRTHHFTQGRLVTNNPGFLTGTSPLAISNMRSNFAINRGINQRQLMQEPNSGNRSIRLSKGLQWIASLERLISNLRIHID